LGIENPFVEKINDQFEDVEATRFWLKGNHDSETTADKMREDGVLVIDHDVVQAGSYIIAGEADPGENIFLNFILPKKGQADRDAMVKDRKDDLKNLVDAKADDGTNIDFVMTHDHAFDTVTTEKVADADTKFHISGHSHHNCMSNYSDCADYHFTTGDSSGSDRDGFDAMYGTGIGRPSHAVSVRLFYVDRNSEPGSHLINRTCEVLIQPNGEIDIKETKLGYSER
jgi:hypothetical protein